MLQQGDPNTDFLSDNFLKLLNESLVFRAPLVVGSSLLKFKTITMCFKHVFCNNLRGNAYGKAYSYKYWMLLPEQLA